MTNSASELIGSVNKGFAGKVINESSDAKTHEVDTPTLTFKAKGGWPHSFPYSYVRSSRHTNEGITVKTQDAIVRIEGKDLEQLYGLIRRQKINEIALSPKQANDSGQSFVESISIHYIDEEITYE
ncbi:MAG: hypothetical protein K6L76_01680 [Agarilytica sp.]